MANGERVKFYRVYVWQAPVRMFHWVSVVCIFCLSVTGYLIGEPLAITYSNEAYQQYWFGTVRFIHFVTAYIFCFAMVYRIYWGFVGNKYAKWDQFIPHTKEQFKEIQEVLKVDILMTKLRGEISLGHNALAGFIYFMLFLLIVCEAITGFALYSSMSDSWMPSMFTWVTPLMGGDFGVRQWHHAFMWGFIVFTIAHVYLVYYHDYVEGRGTTSSMVGGWKFEREGE